MLETTILLQGFAKKDHRFNAKNACEGYNGSSGCISADFYS